jgi:hypothetical protein
MVIKHGILGDVWQPLTQKIVIRKYVVGFASLVISGSDIYRQLIIRRCVRNLAYILTKSVVTTTARRV